MLLLKACSTQVIGVFLQMGYRKWTKSVEKINTRLEFAVCSRRGVLHVLRREDIYMSIHEEKNVSRAKSKHDEQTGRGLSPSSFT